MRFNKSELAALASNPNTKYERSGCLIITERQEGFFRRPADVNSPRWCKLRGNLLFYLKDHDPSSAPAGVLVLENCRPVIKNEERDIDGFEFILEYEGSPPQRICSPSARDRLEWVKCIQLASNSYMNRQIAYLREQIAFRMGNRIERGMPLAQANDAILMNSSLRERAMQQEASKMPLKIEEGSSTFFC